MNLLSLFILILLSLLMFIIMNYLNDFKLSLFDRIIIPNISMIILSSIFTKLKQEIIIFLIFYIFIDCIYLFVISKQELLVDAKNYFLTSIITIFIGIIIYYFFLLKVEFSYVDMEVFKNFIWVLIILYFYHKLNLKSMKIELLEKDNYDSHYKEFIVVSFAKLKNKYKYVIKTTKEIEIILYSFMIYEAYKKNQNIIKNIKNRIINRNIPNDDSKDIISIKEKLESKAKRIKNKSELVSKLVKENYKDINDYQEILKIIKIIEEF